MSDLLAQMQASSRARAEVARARVAEPVLRARALAMPAPPKWISRGFDLIAEIKLRAPSAGALAALDAGQIAERAVRYADAGASAVSVLTEPLRFDGELGHLEVAARDLPIPAMRKDFLVDPYQIWEARVAGAGGVLLIARMLGDAPLRAMMATAEAAGLFALIEAFDADDLRRTAAAIADSPRGTWLVGVNTRDLRTLQVVPDRLARLSAFLPDGVPTVAESGMATPADVALAASHGYTAALVGSALMRADDPAALIAAMRQAAS